MNKILSISMILGAAVMFTACAGEEEDLFDKSAAERLNEMKSIYSARLEAQPAGWAMQYYPTAEGDGYLILADFNADHSVKVAMRNPYTDNKYAESRSVWDVITDNGPVLSFNTYNDLLHIFSDPDDFWGGELGTGIGGDYEFVIVDAPEDASYMMLKGKKRGTYTLLTPLEEGTDFETYFEDVINYQNAYFASSAPNQLYLRKHVGDPDAERTYTFDVNNAAGNIRAMITLEGLDAITYGNLHSFIVTKRGGKYYIRFKDDVSVGDGEIVREMVYDEANDQFVDTAEGTVVLCSSAAPEFLQESWEGGHAWTIQKKNNTSEKYNELMTAASSALTKINRKYKIGDITMTQSDNGLSELSIQYGDSKQWAKYLFNYELSGNQLVYTYNRPSNDASGNIKNANVAIEQFIMSFSGTYTVAPEMTNLNLSKIKLTSQNDANYWIILNY